MNQAAMAVRAPVDGRRRSGRTLFLLLALTTLALTLLSAGTGAIDLSPGQALAVLGDRVGLSLPWTYASQQADVLLNIRLPRILLGLLVGAALAVSGGAMQGMFRNPLADPGLIGISSGAALAVVIAIVAGSGILAVLEGIVGQYALSLAAFLGGGFATLLVYRISSINGRVSVATMLLAGIAVNALAGAGTGIFIYAANDAQIRTITFWGLGSLGGASWEMIAVIGPCVLIALAGLLRTSRNLNALLLGEAEAGHLGTNVDRTKIAIVGLTALCVGASVAAAGAIGFVGLVVPHLLRLVIGPDHRLLLPASALLGGSLLVGADLIARTIVAPTELPIGIVTATVGAPFFLWLLLKNRGGLTAWKGGL